MTGDFSRLSFDPAQHFSQVLLQQGRVLSDADWNEMSALMTHQIRRLARTLIGPHGGNGFEITKGAAGQGYLIGLGDYYVDGILCENRLSGCGASSVDPLPFLNQPNYTPTEAEQKSLDGTGPRLFVLLVTERHVTWVQSPGIREPALGPNIDTCTRIEVVWQAKAVEDDLFANPVNLDDAHIEATVPQVLDKICPPSTAPCLFANLDGPAQGNDECNIAPDHAYRGAGNQLYRVEIHDQNTFKWSRENGAVVFPVSRPQLVTANNEAISNPVRVDSLGLDARTGLNSGDYIEIEDNRSTLGLKRSALNKVVAIRPEDRTVRLKDDFNPPVLHDRVLDLHPLLRRWDGRGDIARAESEAAGVPLEKGIRIKLKKPADAAYQPGDYWLIRANAGDGAIEPNEEWMTARRQTRRCAPLAVLRADGTFSDRRKAI